MARVVSFQQGHNEPKLHPTEVICTYHSGTSDNGAVLLQLDTTGSEDRQIQGKISQTLQFDEVRAKELWDILGKQFGFKS